MKLTFPFKLTKASSYGIASVGALDSGPCTESGDTIFCALTHPSQPESLFFVGVNPALQRAEKIKVELTSSPSGKLSPFEFLVPAGPPLTTRATAKEHMAGETTPHTSFDVTLMIAGGPFQNIVLDAPPGAHFGFSSSQKPSGRLSCGVRTLGDGRQRTICTLPPRQLASPPGTYRFGVNFASPLKPGTELSGSVARTGVGAPKTFGVKTSR